MSTPPHCPRCQQPLALSPFVGVAPFCPDARCRREQAKQERFGEQLSDVLKRMSAAVRDEAPDEHATG